MREKAERHLEVIRSMGIDEQILLREIDRVLKVDREISEQKQSYFNMGIRPSSRKERMRNKLISSLGEQMPGYLGLYNRWSSDNQRSSRQEPHRGISVSELDNPDYHLSVEIGVLTSPYKYEYTSAILFFFNPTTRGVRLLNVYHSNRTGKLSVFDEDGHLLRSNANSHAEDVRFIREQVSEDFIFTGVMHTTLP